MSALGDTEALWLWLAHSILLHIAWNTSDILLLSYYSWEAEPHFALCPVHHFRNIIHASMHARQWCSWKCTRYKTFSGTDMWNGKAWLLKIQGFSKKKWWVGGGRGRRRRNEKGKDVVERKGWEGEEHEDGLKRGRLLFFSLMNTDYD